MLDFRDRYSPARAKDDSLDARVLADALRTDLHHFRRIDPVDPVVIELRAWSRIDEDLTRDRTRLSNRVREQLWRYYPQILEAVGNVVEPWVLDLWAKVPTPAKARRIERRTLERLLKRHRIRRITADQLQEILRAPAIAVAPGTTEAAVAHIRSFSERLRLVHRQLADAKREIARLIDVLADSEDSGSGQPGGQRDVTVLSSLPGVGQTVLATLLAEAPQALARRDYKALRCMCGVAPVTRRSASTSLSCAEWPPMPAFATQSTTGRGSQSSVIPSARPSTPPFAGAATATACLAFRRLLAVACAMLRTQTCYRPPRPAEDHAA
ncbi:MAG: IS110 family transposase [Gemmatimonadetes bacterium]|nr:IS110 family transposase [Gemmatimonadota bacterium]